MLWENEGLGLIARKKLDQDLLKLSQYSPQNIEILLVTVYIDTLTKFPEKI